MLPFIKEKLKTHSQNFFMIALLARDTPTQTDLLKSFTGNINHYDLIDYAEKTTQSTPVTTINRYSGHRLLLQQHIYRGGNQVPPSNPQGADDKGENNEGIHILYTFKATHLPNPKNRCAHKHIISKPPNPFQTLPLTTLTSASQITYATSPDLLVPSIDYCIIAHRILYLSTIMSSLYETLPVITRAFPHISLPKPPLNYHPLTLDQLNTILANFTRSSGHCTPQSYNQPLFLTTKSALNRIPTALPSFNPESQSFEESNDIPLCTDKQPLRNLTDVYTL
jgi:hypothetical protein